MNPTRSLCAALLLAAATTCQTTFGPFGGNGGSPFGTHTIPANAQVTKVYVMTTSANGGRVANLDFEWANSNGAITRNGWVSSTQTAYVTTVAAPIGDPITHVRLRHGGEIDAIAFRRRSGWSSSLIGGTGGTLTGWYESGGQQLSGFSGRSGSRIDQLTLHLRPTAKPAAVSSLSAQATATDRVRLQWNDNSSNELGFRIERAVGNGNYSFLTNAGANATSFYNTGLSAGVLYRYRVRAYNIFGQSDWQQVSETTPQVQPPAGPVSLTTNAISLSEVRLQWSHPDPSVAIRIDQRNATLGQSFVHLATVTGASIYLDIGLSQATQYEYRIRAENGAGASGWIFGNATTTSFGCSYTQLLGPCNDYALTASHTIANNDLSLMASTFWVAQDDLIVWLFGIQSPFPTPLPSTFCALLVQPLVVDFTVASGNVLDSCTIPNLPTHSPLSLSVQAIVLRDSPLPGSNPLGITYGVRIDCQ